jgi:uncharacterized protein
MPTDSKPDSPSIVLDTNVIVSAILFKGSLPREVLIRALNNFQVVFSGRSWDELALVLQRPKFDKCLPIDQRLLALSNLASKIRLVQTSTTITECRDPKDNKFLALAIDAQASTLVTGDQDLLVMHPFRGIAIQTPAQFLQSGGVIVGG